MPAPRIDTLRRTIASSIDLLTDAQAVLETLHELAYDRAAAAEQQRVAGGQPDYALDRHGDPRARAAYADLGAAVLHAASHIANHAGHAVALVNTAGTDTSTGRRRPTAISALELAEALDAQARRLARGEFDPGRSSHQPLPKTKQITGRIKALENQLKTERRARQRAEAQLARLESRTKERHG